MQADSIRVSGKFAQERMSVRLGRNNRVNLAVQENRTSQMETVEKSSRRQDHNGVQMGRGPSETNGSVEPESKYAGIPMPGDLEMRGENRNRAKLEKIVERAMLGRELSMRIEQMLNPGRPIEERGRDASEFLLDYEYREVEYETEQLEFGANGIVQTSDGREIRFNVQLSMSREFVRETGFGVRLESGQMTDPLVLSVDAPAAELQEGTFRFDLNGDGVDEDIAGLGKGQGFLALDRDGDGSINHRSELFGPRSGNGFAELRELDDDGNGWIDEADSAYQRLRLWRPATNAESELSGSRRDSDASEMRSLAEAQVGAIYLRAVDSEFSLKGENNRTLGEISKSSIFLKENGEASIIQHVNLLA